MPNNKMLLVLAHGIFGWGDSRSGGKEFYKDPYKDYYYGIKPFLERNYRARLADVLAPTVPASDSVERRGEALKKAIEVGLNSLPKGTPVHIIAHSMGGLDARWVIAEGGMAESIRSLTTIATPHQGTTLGNLAHSLYKPIRGFGKGLDSAADLGQDVRALLARLGKTIRDPLGFYHRLLRNVIEDSTEDEMERGLKALTIEGCEEFNLRLAPREREVRDKQLVRYIAYGGVLQKKPLPVKLLHGLLRMIGKRTEKPTDPIGVLEASHDFMMLNPWTLPQERDKGNDGAVSVWSAHFPWDSAPWPPKEEDERTRYYAGTVPFDHFRQINWRIPNFRKSQEAIDRDLPPFYMEIMDRILGSA